MDTPTRDTATTPLTLSPFSNYSAGITSEATSEELPDLGAFTTVFRALGRFQARAPPSLPFIARTLHVDNDDWEDFIVFGQRDEEHDDSGTGSVVLEDDSSSSDDHEPDLIQFDMSEEEEGYASGSISPSPSPSIPISQRQRIRAPVVEDDIHLGSALDEALSFIAAERARWASTTTSAHAHASYSPSTNTDSPRRKRRRKRKPLPALGLGIPRFKSMPGSPSHDLEDEHESSDTRVRDKDKDDNHTDKIRHSKSTPSLRTHRVSESLDAFGDISASGDNEEDDDPATPHLKTGKGILVLRKTPSMHTLKAHDGIGTVNSGKSALANKLRTLAAKLRANHPGDARYIDAVMLHGANSSPQGEEWFDTRGPEPGANNAPIHVFVDHSNILFGLLNHLKTMKRSGYKFPNTTSPFKKRPALTPTPLPVKKPAPHLSHAALALVLERGRPITRRALVTSSPLYQPVDSAERLGYDVKIYVRVPDMGDGPDRARKTKSVSSSGSFNMKKLKPKLTPKGQTTHKRRVSDTSVTSVETSSGSGENAGTNTTQSDSVLPTFRSQKHGSSPRHSPHTLTMPTTTPRIKYREQGVDELIQLKLLQALAASDLPPIAGSTIVLATGDGNIGQFNEEGFLGCVRTALRRGWDVELYAWEEGLSRAWRREFGNGEDLPTTPITKRRQDKGDKTERRGTFRIVGLESYWEELVALSQPV